MSTDLNWLITAFAERTPGVAHAALVSADGLPLARSRSLPRDRADQLAAVTAGLTSLMQGASRIFEGGPVTQTVVEMDRGVLVAMGAAAGAALVVLAAADCDLGLVAYEMALLTERTGPSLSPAQRSAPDATGASRP
ncbi:MAG TPA: roadblock/LC7 domain-containing protein [Streptosporangiaceae bacterium]|nr:roadblock/LC7 domain-containing protein [Streptosporangiaceae bacterium]